MDKWTNVSSVLIFANAFLWGRKVGAAKIAAVLAATTES